MSTSQVNAYLAESASDPLHPATIPRREVRPNDVSIKIRYCGICHSDVSLYRNEWGVTQYPVTPGHEIVGVVDAIGNDVTKFKLGDTVGIGCIVDSCRTCTNCKKDLENYCKEGFTGTYGLPDKRTGEVQYGGYSEKIIVDENFVLRIPDNLDQAAAAPLLCAGITTYAPLVDAKIGNGSKVGIVGIGGLGHVAIKLGRAVGAEVYAFTTKESKKQALLDLGATDVIVTTDKEQFSKVEGTLDLVIDTVSGEHDLNLYLSTLRHEGTFTMVGLGGSHFKVPGFPLIMKGAYFHGSVIGGIARTQEMLDLCGKHNITADIEMAHLKDLPTLYQRIDNGDVRFRFVLDIENDFNEMREKN